jgi:hypothetical protein
MAIVFEILEDERRRLVELKESYERRIAELPRGSLSRKKRWNKDYCYLAYREAGKVKFDYIGPADSEAVEEMVGRVEQRKTIEKKLREVLDNLDQVERGLRGQR